MGISSLIFVPVMAGDRPWGVLLFGYKQTRPWSLSESEALKAAADIIGAALFRERVEQEGGRAQRRGAARRRRWAARR